MRNWHFLYKKSISSSKILFEVLLENRGIKKETEKSEFLHPLNPQDLDPISLGVEIEQLNIAVKRITKAKKDNESVVVYTDYDADGVCGGTIVWETLHNLKIKVMPYIPQRVEEGYGLSEIGIDNVYKLYKPKLIITVDHGITGGKKIDYAKKLGIDTIVIDHHVKGIKNSALAEIHTTKLCATGLSWIFCNFLLKKLAKSTEKIKNDLDIVALATVADLVPLIGPNRSFVKYGLKRINNTSRLGLAALIKTSGLEKREITTFEIGHILAPRINAMGRLLHALDAMRLLCTLDENRAFILSQKLNHTNKDRQFLTDDTVSHAKNLYQNNLSSKKLIFLAHESYNQGIIGLVAGKLVEEYYLPTIVLAKGEEFSKASARSINGFNIIETIRKVEDLLVDCGGHPMAAGFTVRTKHIEILQKKLEDLVQKDLSDELLVKTFKIDCLIDLNIINFNLYKQLESLEPFGVGNPEPIFVSKNVEVKKTSLVGREKKHLKVILGTQNTNFNAIGFGLGHLYEKLYPGIKVDIAFAIGKDSWNGAENLQLKLKDVKIASN